MKLLVPAAVLLSFVSGLALAHDPASHTRRAAPVECAQFVGKDPKTIDLKDPVVKAAHDKCEAAKKAQKVQEEAERHQ